MQQLQQISMLGRHVPFYALRFDITAPAANETKVQQQQQLAAILLAVANIVHLGPIISNATLR
jgi:hypothetical protein